VRSRRPLVIAAFGLLVATGCTTTSEGTPLPGSTSTSETPSNPSSDEPPSGDLPSDGAPKVEKPLDVSHFAQSPCDALTPENAQILKMPSVGEQSGDSLGNGCRWINKQTSGSLSIDFFSADRRGLSSVYREAKGSDFPHFEPIDDIGGHPAVAFHPEVAKPTVDCVVAVGVTDQLVFDARVALSDANIGKKDPCSLAAQAADMMMKTMQEAA
jgi:hypothetical protein